jgi:PHD/YefM family antitoxin component YafN of YafNO toxin-antitoxin module
LSWEFELEGEEERTMHKIIGVTELQRRFRPVFDQVTRENVPYVLMRGNKPGTTLIPTLEAG